VTAEADVSKRPFATFRKQQLVIKGDCLQPADMWCGWFQGSCREV